MENIKEILESCKSYSEVCRKFNYPTNGWGIKKVKELSKKHKFDIRLLDERFKYNLNPKKCKCCKKDLDFLKRSYHFCSQSCSAKIKNLGKKKSEETKKKIKNANTGKIYNINGKNITCRIEKSKIHYKNCKVCNKLFVTNSKKKCKLTCSRECQTIASINFRPYQNGSRKNIYYEHKTLGTILLESSWEEKLAKFLDTKYIDWIRPKFLRWTDKENKSRLYYPDFYLPEYDLYLDPKNPYCISKDKEKLEYFKDKIKLFYGKVEDIILKLGSVVNWETT